MTSLELFLVGGAVRDRIMGLTPKDLDFVVTLGKNGVPFEGTDPFGFMVSQLEAGGVTLFKGTDGQPVGHEFFTARGRFPTSMDPNVFSRRAQGFAGKAADFVLARKEAEYTDGRRPDVVEVGTLMDDLRRRDFTMNAMAEDMDGRIIDPFDGRTDISHRLIRAVDDPNVRLEEDALRAVRALRFCVMKNMLLDPMLASAMEGHGVLRRLQENISAERISDELSRMFRFDTLKSLEVLGQFPHLRKAIFSAKRVSLDSTLKQKGRGK